MKIYVDISTTDKIKNVAKCAIDSVDTNIPIAITFTNRKYVKVEYFGKWEHFKEVIEAYSLERYNFRKDVT